MNEFVMCKIETPNFKRVYYKHIPCGGEIEYEHLEERHYDPIMGSYKVVKTIAKCTRCKKQWIYEQIVPVE